MNVTDYVAGIQNITTITDLRIYSSQSLFLASIGAVFIIYVSLQLLFAMIFLKQDRGGFYAIFVLTTLILGIMLFFTFGYPIIPDVIDKILGGIL